MPFKKHNPGCPCCFECSQYTDQFATSQMNVTGTPSPDCRKDGITTDGSVNGRARWRWTANGVDWELQFNGLNYVIFDRADATVAWSLSDPTHNWRGTYSPSGVNATGYPVVGHASPYIDNTRWEVVAGDWYSGVNWNFWTPLSGIYSTTSGSLLLYRGQLPVHWIAAQISVTDPIGDPFNRTPHVGSAAIVVVGYLDTKNYLYAKYEKTASSPDTWEISLCKVAGGTHSTVAGPVSYLPGMGSEMTAITATYDGTHFSGGISRLNSQSIYLSAEVTGYGQACGVGSGDLVSTDWLLVTSVSIGNCIACCGSNGKAPLRMAIELSGIANGTCGDAANFNDTFVAVTGWNCTEFWYRNGNNVWIFRDLSGIGCGSPPLDPGVDAISATIHCGLLDGVTPYNKIVVAVGGSVPGTVLRYERDFQSADLWGISNLDIPLVFSSGVLDGSASTCRISSL